MEATQSLEFMWEGAPDLKTEGQILTHELSENYCFPMELYVHHPSSLPPLSPSLLSLLFLLIFDNSGYDFESHNTNNNPPITPRNLASRSQDFVDIIMTVCSLFLYITIIFATFIHFIVLHSHHFIEIKVLSHE